MSLIKNPNYRQFLDQNMMITLDEADLLKIVNNIRHKYTDEARALIAVLYYTGCRPVEALNIKAKDIIKEKRYVVINVPSAKRGLPRPVSLLSKYPLVKEIYKFSSSLFPEQYVFWHFKSNYKQNVKCKYDIREYAHTSVKLAYHFKKWSKALDIGVIPLYYLRHNRFTKLAQKGATDRELRQLKGSKTNDSIVPYLHHSKESSRKLARYTD